VLQLRRRFFYVKGREKKPDQHRGKPSPTLIKGGGGGGAGEETYSLLKTGEGEGKW